MRRLYVLRLFYLKMAENVLIPCPQLPIEIIEMILSFLSTDTIETKTSKVCTAWKSTGERIIALRLRGIESLIPPETLSELRTGFIGDNVDLKVLKEHERINMGQKFRILLGGRNFTVQVKIIACHQLLVTVRMGHGAKFYHECESSNNVLPPTAYYTNREEYKLKFEGSDDAMHFNKK